MTSYVFRESWPLRSWLYLQDKISVDHIAGDEVAFYGFLRQFEERSARSSRVSIHPEVLENLGSARGGQGKHFQLILSRR